jgi:hypothetical protein
MGKNNIITVLIFAIIALTSLSCNNGNNTSKKENLPQYDFEKEATITGTLQEIKYTNGGDIQMNTYILVLDKPINIISNSKDYETQKNVLEIQLGFSEKASNPYVNLNKKITVKGTLYPAQTINDRRPATMIDVEIIN